MHVRASGDRTHGAESWNLVVTCLGDLWRHHVFTVPSISIRFRVFPISHRVSHSLILLERSEKIRSRLILLTIPFIIDPSLSIYFQIIADHRRSLQSCPARFCTAHCSKVPRRRGVASACAACLLLLSALAPVTCESRQNMTGIERMILADKCWYEFDKTWSKWFQTGLMISARNVVTFFCLFFDAVL